MKILMVHPDEVGDPNEVTWRRTDALARRAARRGHEVRLVDFSLAIDRGQCVERELEPGLVAIGRSRGRKQIWSNARWLAGQAHWADVVHFAQADFHSALPAIYAAYVAAKPLHYDWDRWDLARFKNLPGPRPSLARFALLAREALVPAMADTASTASGGLWILAQGYGMPHTRLVEVPNGCDVTAFHPAADGTAMRQRLALEGKVVATVIPITQQGGGSHYEGEPFLHACRCIADARPDVTFVVAGGGPRRAALLEQAAGMGIAQRTVFLGDVPHDQMPAVYAAADAVLQCWPANEDVQMLTPMRIAEAMASGKAIVASHVGELERMAGGAAMLVPPGDARTTADAVLGLLDDPARRADLGRKARARAVEAYNWEIAASNLIQAWTIAVETHKGAGGRPWPWSRVTKFLADNRDIMGVLSKTESFVGPTTIQIDLSNDCNTDCVACWCRSPLLFENHMPAKTEDELLPLDLTKKLLDDAAALGVKEIYYAGGGEPFMHPDILEILAYTKQKGMVAFVNTNFSFVDQDVIDHVCAIGLDHFTVSMWAGSGPVYALTHPNQPEETYDEVKEHLTRLNRQKKERPYIKVYHVISRLNYHELEAMVQFACETDSESVEFTLVDTVPGKTDYLLLDERMRQELYAMALSIQKRTWTRASGKPLQLFRYDEFLRRVACKASTTGLHDKNIIDALPCYVGWLFARVLPNGNVNFCLKAHRIPTGNLHTHSFKQIWSSQVQKQYRGEACIYSKEENVPFFSKIGNDPSQKVGCYKSCDDLGRNQELHGRWMTMPLHKRIVLEAATKIQVARGQFQKA